MNIIRYSIRSFFTNEYYSIIRFASKRLFVATLGAVPKPGGAGGVWPDSPGAAPRHHPPVRPRPLQPRPVTLPGRGVLLWPSPNIQVTKKKLTLFISAYSLLHS